MTILEPLPSLSFRFHTTKSRLSSILYYITGHGFGHAVRSHQVIRALLHADDALSVHVRTSAAPWLFANSPMPVSHSRQSLDVGIIQRDSLRMELAETLESCRMLYGRASELIEQELAFIKAHKIQLIVADTPPLAFEIAARAGLPSVSITNFTWDFIYRAYLDEHADFAPLIEQMTAYYGKTSLALTLPYPCDTSMFPRQQAIPWVARRSTLTKERARDKFDLPRHATIVLISFGGLGLDRIPWDKLKQQRQFIFVTTGATQHAEDNVVVLADTQNSYEDLVCAVDCIVTKPGYGIVADVLAHRLPILYTDRGDFAEFPKLVQALRDCATCEHIPQQELLAGNLEPYLSRLLATPPHWPAVDLRGAEVAAAEIMAML